MSAGPLESEGMPSLVTSAKTEQCLRSCLAAEGYGLSCERRHGETGVDIRAIRNSETIFIEVIGFKSSPPARAKDFYESFFRAVSRLNDDATRCVIAAPLRFREGLPARAKQHAEAWARIGRVFPELEIWLVNTEAGSYSTSKWIDWLSNPRGQPTPASGRD